MHIKLKLCTVSLCLAAVLLAGCGFHLRGQNALPPSLHRIYICTEKQDTFTRQLQQSLASIGVQVVDQAALANTSIEIYPEQFKQQLVSTNAQNQIYQYILTYQVNFQLKDARGWPIGPLQTVVITRTLSANANQILSDANSQLQLQQAMRQDAIAQIINRLSFVATH